MARSDPDYEGRRGHDMSLKEFLSDSGSDLNLNVSEIQKFFQAINDEISVATDQENIALDALSSLRREMRTEATAAYKEEIEWQKKILKIELQLEKSRLEGDKKHEKHLEKALKIAKQTKEIRENTSKAVSAYEEEIEAIEDRRKAKKEAEEAGKKLLTTGWQTGDFKQMMSGLKLSLTGGASGGAGVVNALDKMTQALTNLLQKLDKSIEEIVKYKSDWDTRLFGSGSNHTDLVGQVTKNIGVSPFVKQADVMKNIDKAIESGIAYNIAQRAFLETVKDDIARTFDAFDSTLLQIVRVQQSDSTAARLGMETTLNQFLNSMYANTEYLNGLSDSVTGALYEATSLLSASESIGFEYQIQKWLGSLYSVGMSQGSVTSIAQALGNLASGNISNIDSGAGRLLVMAASRGNLNYSDMLTKGLNDSDINTLLYNVVDYLAQIANSNKVVQTQYANIFGLQTSDIIAARNLKPSLSAISTNGLTYESSINALNQMAKTIGSRQQMGEWLENAFGNLQYTLASGIAESPVLYSIWKVSNLLDDLVGGIPLPFVSAVGSGVDLETTVSDLMKVGTFSVSLLSSMGSLINAVGASGGLGNGVAGMLSALGVSTKVNTVTRGSGLTGGLGDETISTSTYVGNTSGQSIENASLAAAETQKEELMVQNNEQHEQVDLEDVNTNIVSILEILQGVFTGDELRVRIRTGDNPSNM